MTSEQTHNKGVGKGRKKGFGSEVMDAAGKKPFLANPGGTYKSLVQVTADKRQQTTKTTVQKTTVKTPKTLLTKQQNKPKAGKGRKQ